MDDSLKDAPNKGDRGMLLKIYHIQIEGMLWSIAENGFPRSWDSWYKQQNKFPKNNQMDALEESEMTNGSNQGGGSGGALMGVSSRVYMNGQKIIDLGGYRWSPTSSIVSQQFNILVAFLRFFRS